MISGLTFTYGCLALFLSVNALRKPAPPTSRFPPLWLPAMITAELAPAAVVIRLGLAALAYSLGAWDNPVGRFGIGLILTSIVLLIPVFRLRAKAARQLIDAPLPRRTPAELFLGRHRKPESIAVESHVEYAPGLTLDLYRPRDTGGELPLLMYIHGGSWTGGRPDRQALAMYHHFAESGWLVAAIRYPLSPAATFPEHLIGVKQAIVWAKHHPGVDPARVVLAGGSAGAHLAALAALTANRSEYQPGFEDGDTAVAGCVPIYGVYDFFNRNRTRWDWPVIPRHVMKTTPSEAPELYRAASPLDQVGPTAPPFLVVHGEYDSLVPPVEATQFVTELARHGRVDYLEVIGGQHAFDVFNTPRSRGVAQRVHRHLEAVLLDA